MINAGSRRTVLASAYRFGLPAFALLLFAIAQPVDVLADPALGLSEVCSDTSRWTSYIDGTASPQPACRVTKFSNQIDIPFAAAVGIADRHNQSSIVNDQTHIQYSQGLIQAETTKDYNHQESGFAINFISRTGRGLHPTPNGADFSQKVGLYVSCLMLPMAANTWCENVDLVLNRNVGRQNAYLRESDESNFNGPYTPGISNGLGSVALDFRTFHGFPITAAELWSNDAPHAQVTARLSSGSRSIRVVGGILSVGDQLSGPGLPPHTYVESIDGSLTKVNSQGNVVMTNPSSVTITERLEATTFNMFDGFILNGQSLIRDATFTDGSSSRQFLKLYGNHDTVIDSTSADLKYLWTAAKGQAGCFDVFDACWSSVGGLFRFTQNGGVPLQIVGAKQGFDGVQIASAASGGPTISSTSLGSEKTIPLNLKGVDAPVRVLGPAGLSVDGPATAASYREALRTPRSSRAPCHPGEFADDENYHYVCVSQNRWKRIALSDF